MRTDPSLQPRVSLDWILKFLRNSRLTSYDPGFVNTASSKSGITFIDGDLGILQYRDYPIEQLASKKSFLEVAFLMINVELPSKTELEQFDSLVRRHTLLHSEAAEIRSECLDMGFRNSPESYPCTLKARMPCIAEMW